MPMYTVSVEKKLYSTGSVVIEADSADEAIEKVDEQIKKGTLQMSNIEWDDPEYEDCSFGTTGDVD